MQKQIKYNNCDCYHCQDGYALYLEIKQKLLEDLHTSLDTFNEASLHCQNVLLRYYKILPSELMYTCLAMWFNLKLKYKNLKVVHIADRNYSVMKLKCLFCNDIKPEYITSWKTDRIVFYFLLAKIITVKIVLIIGLKD